MIEKAATGITGFDELTGGGLPRGRITLLIGGAGTGKTIMALQSLVNAARELDESGVFVAFEERSGRIRINAAGFGWQLDELPESSLTFLDCQPSVDLVQSGSFDLGGLLAGLGAVVDGIGARRVVLDAVDTLLILLPDQHDVRQEVYRLLEWLLERQQRDPADADPQVGNGARGPVCGHRSGLGAVQRPAIFCRRIA